MNLKIILSSTRKNSIRFLIGIAQSLYINLGFGKFDNFITRRCSTYSICCVMLQVGPGIAPHNEMLGWFYREMSAESHLVGYIKTIYSLTSEHVVPLGEFVP